MASIVGTAIQQAAGMIGPWNAAEVSGGMTRSVTFRKLLIGQATKVATPKLGRLRHPPSLCTEPSKSCAKHSGYFPWQTFDA